MESFARVATGAATNGAFLEHAEGGVHLRGYVQTDGLALWVKRPVLFSGWLVPRGPSVLRWTEGKELVVVDEWEPAALHGWIPDSVFMPPPGRVVGGHHTRAPQIRQGETTLKPTKRVTCEATVKILAEVGGRRAWVGEIDARTPIVFNVDDGSDRFLELVLEGAYAQKGARLAAERSVLAACKPITPR